MEEKLRRGDYKTGGEMCNMDEKRWGDVQLPIPPLGITVHSDSGSLPTEIGESYSDSVPTRRPLFRPALGCKHGSLDCR